LFDVFLLTSSLPYCSIPLPFLRPVHTNNNYISSSTHAADNIILFIPSARIKWSSSL